MWLKCLIKRADGSPTVIFKGGHELVFKPNEHGDYVCDVLVASIADELLATGRYAEYTPPRAIEAREQAQENDLDGLSREELFALAERHGLEVSPKSSTPTIIAKIKRARENA